MGFRSKRQAKKLPDLIDGLEFLRTAGAAPDASEELGDQQMGRPERVAPHLDTMIKEANAYLDEYRAAGDIADPGFRRWFKHAEASLSVGLASTRQERRQMKKAGQY